MSDAAFQDVYPIYLLLGNQLYQASRYWEAHRIIVLLLESKTEAAKTIYLTKWNDWPPGSDESERQTIGIAKLRITIALFSRLNHAELAQLGYPDFGFLADVKQELHQLFRGRRKEDSDLYVESKNVIDDLEGREHRRSRPDSDTPSNRENSDGIPVHYSSVKSFGTAVKGKHESSDSIDIDDRLDELSTDTVHTPPHRQNARTFPRLDGRARSPSGQ